MGVRLTSSPTIAVASSEYTNANEIDVRKALTDFT